MSTEYVKNRIGEIVGRIEKSSDTTYVYDRVGALAGRCENGQTFNEIGEVISYSEVPGLLIKDN